MKDASAPPDGFLYEADVLPIDEERELVEHIGKLPLKEFEFHGVCCPSAGTTTSASGS
jgi:hypothetical protein